MLNAMMKQEQNSGARLVDAVIDAMKLKNDAALSRKLKVQPPIISKLRNGKLPVTPNMILRVHELTGWKIDAIYKFSGVVPLLSQEEK